MGQKVNPIGFRVGIAADWRARWYAGKKDFGLLLVQDQKLRKYIKKNYHFAGISKIEIERTRDVTKVILFTARPGVIIGRRGAEVEKLRVDLEHLVQQKVELEIKEVANPDIDSQLVAEAIAEQLEKRASYRKVIKKQMDGAVMQGAKGIKVQVSGRLSGAEIARAEKFKEGANPLQTLWADIDYGFAEACTTHGQIGVKVWIYKGMKSREETKENVDAKEGKVQKESEGKNQG